MAITINQRSPKKGSQQGFPNFLPKSRWILVMLPKIFDNDYQDYN
jgi:hypothetical protein